MNTLLKWIAVLVVGTASVFLAQRLILKLYKSVRENRRLAQDVWRFGG